MENQRVLGIDVGIAITGWAVVEKDNSSINKIKLIDYGAIITDSTEKMNVRLKILYDNLCEVIEHYKPSEMAVESVFFFKNQKTIITVGQARGVILLAAEKCGIGTHDYTPLQVKTAVTGYGRAEKSQIQKMVKLIYKLKEIPKPDDVADAIAVATCHINQNSRIANST